MWLARAMHEIRESNRTWFGTLTLRPEAHYEMQSRGLVAATARSIPTKELSVRDVEQLQWKEVAKELTKFLKRLRKATGSGSLRYMLVQEVHTGERITRGGPHITGLPHYHLLLHEVSSEQPIKYRDLEAAWHLGFVRFKLVDEQVKAALYVSKYLGKANEGRVRASIGYGRFPEPKGETIQTVLTT